MKNSLMENPISDFKQRSKFVVFLEADGVGFSKMMSESEDLTLRYLKF